MSFRKDIELLRGVAVLLVVLFHLGLPSFKSGFIGVDIFFVVSGFLMAGTLNRLDYRNVVDFYWRRGRRILPALIAVSFLSLIFGLFILLPFDIKSLTEEIISSSLFIPNFSFWLDDSYFEKQLFRPTLHFWSLGVEIQYYLLFPLILYFHKKHWLYSFTLLIASLALCIFLTPISPKTTFFLTPFRLWEFLVGFLVYQISDQKPSLLKNKFLQGGVFFFCAIFLFNYSGNNIQTNNFPGPGAIPPVLAAALLMYFNFQPSSKFLNLLLAPLALLGRMSYSVYLVHFVVFSFFIYDPFERQPMGFSLGSDLILALIITAIFSVLIYQTIENPCRSQKVIANRTLLKLYLGSVVMLAVLITSLGVNGWSWKTYPGSISKVFYAVDDKADFRCGVVKRILEPTAASCLLYAGKNDSNKLLLVGDSHLDAIKTTLIDAARENGAQLFLIKQNCALGAGQCDVDKIAREMIERDIDYVILHSTNSAIDVDAVKTLTSIASRIEARIKLVYDVPTWDQSIPAVAYRAFNEEDPSLLPNRTLNMYREQHQNKFKELELIESEYLTLIQVADFFCSPDCRIFDDDGYLLYYDNHHLTRKGSRLLSPLFDELFKNINLNN